jgi:DNA-binding LytR/AlgR family response regulator
MSKISPATTYEKRLPEEGWAEHATPARHSAHKAAPQLEQNPEAFKAEGALERVAEKAGERVLSPKRPEAPRETRSEVLRDVIFVKSNNIVQKLRLKDILFVFAEGNYSTLHTQAGKRFAVKMSLLQIQDALNSEAFLQVHRNYLIRLDAIESINLTANEVQMQGCNTPIPISRNTYRDELLSSLNMLK